MIMDTRKTWTASLVLLVIFWFTCFWRGYVCTLPLVLMFAPSACRTLGRLVLHRSAQIHSFAVYFSLL